MNWLKILIIVLMFIGLLAAFMPHASHEEVIGEHDHTFVSSLGLIVFVISTVALVIVNKNNKNEKSSVNKKRKRKNI